MICTFYSYKGGVGRSMAMANVADVLSRRGLKVLIIDFDLEAPGLEQFFQVNHDAIRRHLGLLDLLLGYKQAMSLGRSEDATFKDVQRFIVPVHDRLPGGGRLDIMPAGQRQGPEQLARYASSLRTFDWQDFYFDWQGGLFFEWLRRALVPEPYDLVLIDSRTGVTEMGGICGYQLADSIVMLCSANHQNLQGTRNMLRDFRSPAVEALRRGRRLDILVVPARIEQRDDAALDAFYQRFEQQFGDFLPPALRDAELDFRLLTIPYEPHFAFEERIVNQPSNPSAQRELGGAFELLADAVLLLHPGGSGVARLSATLELSSDRVAPAPAAVAPAPAAPARPAPAPPARRTPPGPARLQYDAAKRFANYDVFVDASPGDREHVGRLVEKLRSSGLSVFVDREDITPGASWLEVVEEVIFRSHELYFCIGVEGLSALRLQTLSLARKARERGQQLRIVPVLLPGADPGLLREPSHELAGYAPLDLRGGMDALGEQPLRRPARSLAASVPVIEAEARAPFVGMHAFSEAQADLFFGREASVERLLRHTLERRRVVVAGPSGCGKTSLVEAGLVPALRRHKGQDGALRVVSARLGAHPLSQLLHGLGAPVDPARPPSAADLVDAVRAICAATEGELLLFIDQLEDVLSSDGEARRALLDGVARVMAEPAPNLFFVLALRSSFLASMRHEAAWQAWLPEALFEVPALSEQELRAAIESPVERVGAAFEPGVVDRILREVQGEPSALPLLQALLTELWRDRRDGWLTNDALAKLNGLQGLLAEQAERVYAELPPAQQDALRWIMLRLVRPGQRGEETRRRLPLEDLMPEEALRQPELAATYRAVALRLVEARVLISSEEGGRRVIEPAHEALVRGWERLRGWVAEELEFLSWRDRLGVEVNDWRNRGRSDGVLLRDALLAEAEVWMDKRGGALNAEEYEFIASSQRQRERRRRLLRTVSVAGALVTLALLAGVTLLRLRVSEAQGAAAEALRSAAQTQAHYSDVARAAAETERDLARKERALAEARLAIAEDTIKVLQQTGETLRTLADANAPRASAAEKRAQAGRELKRLQSSLDDLQGRVASTKQRDTASEAAPDPGVAQPL